MEKLREFGVDLEHLIQCIENLKLDESVELKELYGKSKWKKDITSPTKFGKLFKKLVKERKVKNLSHEYIEKDNHNIYKKI